MARKPRRGKQLGSILDARVDALSREIGLRLFRLRRKMGLTTTDLAGKMDMSQAQISRLETGKQGFRSMTVCRLAQILGVSPVYFFVGDDDVSPEDVLAERGDLFGPNIPKEIRQGLGFPWFKHFVVKAARIFLEDKRTFNRLADLVDKFRL